VEALAGVDLDVFPDEIVGLIGPNGSGKSTLMGIVSGLYASGSGTIHFQGQRIDRMAPYRRRRLGIAQTFQATRPLAGMSVLENVMVGALFSGSRPTRRQSLEAAADALETVGLRGREALSIDALPAQELKRLELARALAAGPTLLLLDEVMAGLSDDSVQGLMPAIRAFARHGRSVVMVEHRVTLLFAVVDRVIVLHEGRKIAEGDPRAVVADPAVVSAYLGRRYAQRLLGAS
jgi:branched-chain amino acid transport system ATP-binding protein